MHKFLNQKVVIPDFIQGLFEWVWGILLLIGGLGIMALMSGAVDAFTGASF